MGCGVYIERFRSQSPTQVSTSGSSIYLRELHERLSLSFRDVTPSRRVSVLFVEARGKTHGVPVGGASDWIAGVKGCPALGDHGNDDQGDRLFNGILEDGG